MHRPMMPFFSHPHWSHVDDPWADYLPVSRIYDQHFGVGSESSVVKREPSDTGISEVTNNETEFKVRLDVSHFKLNEIIVKTVNDRLKIHAKHEEHQDDHGFIEREFTRQYLLPKDIDVKTVTCSRSTEGILTVRAPKKGITVKNERIIPIIRGDPADL